MSKPVLGVNPNVLKWARERSGHTLDSIASALGKEADIVAGWESGASAPTYAELEKLAYKLYRRPLAFFFFPEPPDEEDPRHAFRTLPDFEIQNLHPDTRYAIRQAQSMQLSLRELNDGVNPSEHKIFRDIHLNPHEKIPPLANEVRSYLGISLEDQIGWKTTEQALGAWRDAVQEKGIYVFKRSLKQKDVSGFCLLDDEFPVIYLNNSTTFSRQIFTIFHELPHILIGTNGITKSNDEYIGFLHGEARRVEVTCNRFASEFLVPSEDFGNWAQEGNYDDASIDSLADRYKVSREVILRKLLDANRIDQTYYETKSQQLLREYEEASGRRGRSGGNYYATQASYLGLKYLGLAFSRYYQNRCTIEQLANYLNVKVQNVSGLEQFFLRKATV